MDFIKRNLAFISVVIGTLILLIGGVMLFTRKGADSQSGKKISQDILISKDAYQSGGIVNGEYKPQNQKAGVTIVEFGDYQCPTCSLYNPILNKLLTEYSGKINLVVRNFPLSKHSNSLIAAYSAEAAGLQGKFWQMHSLIYDKQTEWSNSTDAKSIFVGYAKGLGLNLTQYEKDLDSQVIKEKVSKDYADGTLAGVSGTPSFFVNNVQIQLPGSYDAFKKIIEDALKNRQIIQSDPEESYHAHFDLKVYTNGKRLDLGLAKYQSAEGKELDPEIHLHDGNGNIVHLHAKDISLKRLFDSLKYEFPKDTTTAALKLFVNGTFNPKGLEYVPQDLDKILLTYGPENDKNFTTQLSSVTDLACIYSLKCPERGSPPSEECVGGLGTGCE